MSQSPATGIPKRKLFTGQNFGGTASAESSPQSVVASEITTAASQGRKGGKRGSRDNSPAPSDNDEPTPSNPRKIAPAAAASSTKTDTRGRSPSGERSRIQGDEGDLFAHALNVIRRNLDDKGRPLIKTCLLLNEFAKKKTGRTNENCDTVLAAVLEALADGRKVDGRDTTTHLDGLAEKLQAKHGDAFSNERIQEFRQALAEAITRTSRDQAFLQPWGRDTEAPDSTKPFTREWRKKAEKRTYFSAEELADKLIGGITSSHASNFFMVSRTVKNMPDVTGAIRSAQNKLAADKPIFDALCKYLLSHERPEITEANANVFLSAMTKPFFRRVDAEDSDTGKMQSMFVIPATAPFMKGAGNITWQKKDKTGKNIGETLRFKKEGDNFVVLLQDRRHLLDLVFPKEANERSANPTHAVIGLLGEMLSQDEKKE